MENINWYKQERVETLMKEAGIKENVTTALLMALLAILSGSTIYGAAQRHKVNEDQIAQALQNDQLMQQVKQVSTQMAPPEQEIVEPVQRAMPYQQEAPQEVQEEQTSGISSDSLVNAIVSHEGLLPKQTPFRITSPAMGNWNTIHGFEIDKTSPRPSNRRNFIFLKNPEDVPKAVKQQFLNYRNKPSRYGLSAEPTLEEAIRVFDQTGADGKISFLKKKFPSINLSAPLSNYF